MIGELQKNKADIGKTIQILFNWFLKCKFHNLLKSFLAVQGLSITLERSSVISFTQPLIYIYYQLFIKNPIGTFNYVAYIEPLRTFSWIFIGIFCITTPPFLYLTTM